MIETLTPTHADLAPETLDFYRKAMTTLQEADLPFLVGGAYAFAHYTGIVRHTKDFDIFIRPEDFDRALEVFDQAGYETQACFPHWLGKALHGDDFVDLIFSSGNGVARVDELWFEHAVPQEVLGIPTRLVPAEEMIWSKAFIMERERFDGADVAHVLQARAEGLDWQRLLGRFGEHWPVLLSHLLLFGYIYPDDAGRLPDWVMDDVLDRARRERKRPAAQRRSCRGPILSRGQYLFDIEERGYADARLEPAGAMSSEEIEIWSDAAREEAEKLLKKD